MQSGMTQTNGSPEFPVRFMLQALANYARFELKVSGKRQTD